MFVLFLISSAEFPVCDASGDQLYPDVCWDGEAFWVVWAENEEDPGKIYASKVNEEGDVEEPFLVCSPGKGVYDPSLACSPDTLLLTFLIEVISPDSTDEHCLCYALLDKDGFPYPGASGSVGIYAAGPMIPVRCKEHFALLYTYGYPAEIEYPTWGAVSLLDGNKPLQILDVPQFAGQFCYVANGVWNEERLFCVTSHGCIWLEDTLVQDPYQEGYFYPRDPASLGSDSAWFYQYVSLATSGNLVGMVCSAYTAPWPWFDLVDSEGNLINENPLQLKIGRGYYSGMAYGNGRFIEITEIRKNTQSYEYTFWGNEIDTIPNLLNEGYILLGPAHESHPDICFGSNHFLLVWCDNRNGDWDIYGRILDSLEYSGVSESSLIEDGYPMINVDQTVFPDVLKINLSPASAGGTVVIHDATGRVVRRLKIHGETCVWNGENSRGETVSPGVYFISLAGKEKGTSLKVIKIR